MGLMKALSKRGKAERSRTKSSLRANTALSTWNSVACLVAEVLRSISAVSEVVYDGREKLQELKTFST